MKILAGTMALRAPDGEFLPSVPIYQETNAEDTENQEFTAAEKHACNELAKKLSIIFMARDNK